jgi:hypothetical protein
MVKKQKDFFYGIEVGDLVFLENGPRHYKGHHALVIARDVLEDSSEDLIKEPEPNITVICREEKVQLWPGWVKKLENE